MTLDRFLGPDGLVHAHVTNLVYNHFAKSLCGLDLCWNPGCSCRTKCVGPVEDPVTCLLCLAWRFD